MVCAVTNGAATCTAGACAVASCVGSFGDCDAMAANGCETDTATSVTHCGGCGRACDARANASAACAAGACVYACDAGFADCDGMAANGCEVDTRSAPANCGMCGRACVAANGTATCAAGVCGLGACNAGFGDCDGMAANGCEVDTRASLAHCGLCDRACPRPANAAPTCAAGVCGIACNTGFADCNANPADGCEVDTRTSAAHCGGCGMACSGTCTAGACQVTGACGGGSNLLSRSPGGNVIVCDHPSDAVCEQDFEALCPAGWSLCSRPQFIARNAGWSYVPAQRVLGTIHCRNGGGAGHFTFGWSSSGIPMSTAEAMNCAFGSSRSSCTASYGCNEQSAFAMCCAPTPSCGNGVVDSPEELCDDGNQNNEDACLNNCTWRAPVANGVSGTSC